MAKGYYNWTPEQLARINARRQSRGQDALSDVKMDDYYYSKAYDQEAERYAGREKQAPAFPKERPSSLDQYAESQRQFREKFKKPEISEVESRNAAERVRVLSEEEKRRKNRNRISTPISESYSRFVA